ncbi:hypothetical protein DFH09DRAFT_1314660 [Mycena vulgaris]|nr:hypothetical protein DFH09DRAFT_1314660 [Mycena vulgaris]
MPLAIESVRRKPTLSVPKMCEGKAIKGYQHRHFSISSPRPLSTTSSARSRSASYGSEELGLPYELKIYRRDGQTLRAPEKAEQGEERGAFPTIMKEAPKFFNTP